MSWNLNRLLIHWTENNVIPYPVYLVCSETIGLCRSILWFDIITYIFDLGTFLIILFYLLLFQLEIIDACVDYIERLQNQLSLHWSFPKIAARKSFLSNSTSTRSEIVKNETRHNIRLRWTEWYNKGWYEIIDILLLRL